MKKMLSMVLSVGIIVSMNIIIFADNENLNMKVIDT